MTAPVTVSDWYGQREVYTLLELEALVASLAATGPPRWVEITGADGRRVLGVAVGQAEVSSLTFTDLDRQGLQVSEPAPPSAGGASGAGPTSAWASGAGPAGGGASGAGPAGGGASGAGPAGGGASGVGSAWASGAGPAPAWHDEAIPADTARRAATEFMQTGERPACVGWRAARPRRAVTHQHGAEPRHVPTHPRTRPRHSASH